MYATRRPSIRRQVVGTFDVTKETAGAEVGDFPPFFYSPSRSFPPSLSLCRRGHCLPHFADEQFAFLLPRKKREDYGKQEKEAIEDGGCPLICRSLTIDPFRERSKR